MTSAFRSKYSTSAVSRAALWVCAAMLLIAAPARVWAAQGSESPFARPVEKNSKPDEKNEAPPAEAQPTDAKPTPRDAPRVTGDIPKRAEAAAYPEGLQVFLAGVNSIGGGAGEITSTVVPPRKKTQCPNGRLLISNDSKNNPGLVYGFDLDALNTVAANVTPQALPQSSIDGNFNDLSIFSNDHDLISLNNGDVLLIRQGHSRKPITPAPPWIKQTYKYRGPKGAPPDPKFFFYPGARTMVYVWRSEDCGGSFALVDMIDLAEVDDGWGTPSDTSAAFPATRGTTGAEPFTDPPGSRCNPLWPMGGSDGILAKADRASGRIFLTMGIAGYEKDPNKFRLVYCDQDDPYFFVNPNRKIRRTAVYMSDDRGSSWRPATTLPKKGWRLAVVPLKSDRLAFLLGGEQGPNCYGNPACWLIYETKIGADVGQAQVRNPAHEGDMAFYGAAEANWSTAILNVVSGVQISRLQRNWVLTRSPSSDGLLFAVPETSPHNDGGGYGLYGINPDGAGYLPFPQIAPSAKKNGFVFHVTAVDLGVGPILFYWYDVNPDSGTMIVRGRLVTRDRTYTSDFNISEAFAIPTSSDPAWKMWFGDYHAAGGIAADPSAGAGGGLTRRFQTARYEYYPVWKQSDGDVRYAKIVYAPPQNARAEGHHHVASRVEIRKVFRPKNMPELKLNEHVPYELDE